MNTSNWKFRITDKNGVVITTLPDASDRKVSRVLNKPGEASLSYDMDAFFDICSNIGQSMINVVGPGRHVLEVFRGDLKYFAGPILPYNRRLSEKEGTVDIKAMGWQWLLNKRHAGLDETRSFTSTQMGEIIATTIDETQDTPFGSFGFIRGVIETSQPITIDYDRKKIAELIEDFTTADGGVDFEITPDRLYNVYYPYKGFDKTESVIYQYPGTIELIEEINDGSQLVNYAYGIGQGWGTQELIAVRQNISSQVSFWRLEEIFPYKDIGNATFLGDIVQQKIDERAAVVPTFKIKVKANEATPDISLVAPGDFITVRVKDRTWVEDRTLRVFEIHIGINDEDMESVNLVVGLI